MDSGLRSSLAFSGNGNGPYYQHSAVPHWWGQCLCWGPPWLPAHFALGSRQPLLRAQHLGTTEKVVLQPWETLGCSALSLIPLCSWVSNKLPPRHGKWGLGDPALPQLVEVGIYWGSKRQEHALPGKLGASHAVSTWEIARHSRIASWRRWLFVPFHMHLVAVPVILARLHRRAVGPTWSPSTCLQWQL